VIKAVIFDLDGLLINSEPLWDEALIETLGEIGIKIDHRQAKKTMGLRSDEVIRYWHHEYPWHNPSQKVVNARLVNRVTKLILKNGEPLEGVAEAICLVEKAHLPMAIASSSPRKVINAALKKMHITHKMEVIYSAEHEPYGKPHPGVFITTAKKLGARPEDCLALEDSPNGIIAAKAAKMKCIAIPGVKLQNHNVFSIADKVVGSLLDLETADFKTL
jgi:sugar-phosphatase